MVIHTRCLPVVLYSQRKEAPLHLKLMRRWCGYPNRPLHAGGIYRFAGEIAAPDNVYGLVEEWRTHENVRLSGRHDHRHTICSS